MSHTKHHNDLVQERLFPLGLIFLIDITITSISFVLSYYICHYFYPDIERHGLLWQLPIIIAITSLIFLLIGVYRGLVKYDRIRQVYSIFNAICLANILTIFFAVVNGTLFMEERLVIPLSIILVHSMLSFMALGASRYLYTYIYTYFKNKFVGYRSVVFVHDMDNQNGDYDRIASFLEENGKKVVGKVNFQGKVAEKGVHNLGIGDFVADEIALFVKSGQVEDVWKVLGRIAKHKKPIFLLQEAQKTKGTGFIEREYKIQRLGLMDLFPVQLRMEESPIRVQQGLQSQTIFITGSGGSIATEFIKRLVDFGVHCQLILLDNSERALNTISTFCRSLDNFKVVSKLGDIKDAKFVEKIYQQYHPNFVLHAAGNNRPEFLGNDIDIILRENVIATKQLADFSKKYGVDRFVFCSSVEAQLPKSTLEVSKRLSELYMDSLNDITSATKFISLRLNRIFDSDSSFVNYIKSQINLGRPITPSEYDEYKTFGNKRDVADTIMYLLSEPQMDRGILRSNLGLRVKTEVLVDLMLSLEGPRTEGHKYASLQKSANGWEQISLLVPPKGNSFNEPPFEKVSALEKLSRDEIQQKIEALCLNTMFHSGNYDEVFDLITEFEPGQWQNMYQTYTSKKRTGNKVINLK